MFSEEQFIKILNESHSGLNAIRYMKQETGLSLTECKAYLDKVMQRKSELIGTIAWFRCDDILPPTAAKSEFTNLSVKVIVADKIHIGTSFFVRTVNETPVGWLGINDLGFNPTHWAYINFPD